MSPNAGAIESPITVLYSCAYRPHTNVEIEIYNKKWILFLLLEIITLIFGVKK